MNLSFRSAPHGRISCEIAEGRGSASPTSGDLNDAVAGLNAALDDVEMDGFGECFWLEPTGTWHWMFRRQDDRLRAVILYSNGIVTGWEHRFYAEWPLASALAEFRLQLSCCAACSPGNS